MGIIFINIMIYYKYIIDKKVNIIEELMPLSWRCVVCRWGGTLLSFWKGFFFNEATLLQVQWARNGVLDFVTSIDWTMGDADSETWNS